MGTEVGTRSTSSETGREEHKNRRALEGSRRGHRMALEGRMLPELSRAEGVRQCVWGEKAQSLRTPTD